MLAAGWLPTAENRIDAFASREHLESVRVFKKIDLAAEKQPILRGVVEIEIFEQAALG
jgi:hypothetical protein